ncbi:MULTISPECIES: WXG100 family type VII secretion target [unclassified Nocardioides]|uniref:WXG100 family type VII secretion target n=1 Tax=unclassified Nocardioides TaxID=2615069 RepID=UPI002666406D|nr:hypothetical protein [Nocardioides sp. Arc9.136]WKN48775.1 hypothetical protein OSR43_01235 [Nocardioides sp. Arc9.136]
MYGDSDAMRRRARQLREQGTDLRTLADQLVARTEGTGWTGRAAESMRERVHDRASRLREAAAGHDRAADSLDRHLQEVDRVKDAIAQVERKATGLVADARSRVSRVQSLAAGDPAGATRTPDPTDLQLAAFDPPPPGHQDWLGVHLPGL